MFWLETSFDLNLIKFHSSYFFAMESNIENLKLDIET